MDREKIGFWFVVDKDGHFPIFCEDRKAAEKIERQFDDENPWGAPHTAVYLQEVEGPEE